SGFVRSPQVGTRQGPPDAAKGWCSGTPKRFPQLGVPPESGQGPPGGRPCRVEAANRELNVPQHRVHLEREPRITGSLGELGGVLRTCEVARHVTGDPAQASIRREQERMPGRIPQSLDGRARLLEEAVRLALADAGDA